jgi:hypothetical protein
VFIARLLDQGNDAFFKQSEGSIIYDEGLTIRVFPNPAKTHLIISSVALPGTTATLYNLTGHAVEHIQLVERQQEISVAHLPKGLYVLRVQRDGSALATEKVVIR